MVLPDSIRISRVRTYSGYFYYKKFISRTGLSPYIAAFPKAFRYKNFTDIKVLQPQATSAWFGLFPLRSSLLRESLLISFIRLLRYFSSPTFLHAVNLFGCTVSRKRDGFPHSEIHGSSLVCKLTEAYRILQRPSSETSVKGSFIYL